MIFFFSTPVRSIIATAADHRLDAEEMKKLCWLYGEATPIEGDRVEGLFVGPRREMVTPWSTNAVEITQNMNLNGISRIEEYFPTTSDEEHDPMLQRVYDGLDETLFTVNHTPEPIRTVDDLDAYNEQEGLALSPAEISTVWSANSVAPLPTVRSLASHNSIRNTAVTRFSAARLSLTARKCPPPSLP